jgi:hypothetical protein
VHGDFVVGHGIRRQQRQPLLGLFRGRGIGGVSQAGKAECQAKRERCFQGGHFLFRWKKKGSSSFLKKRTKKLLSLADEPNWPVETDGWAKQSKVFWFFFSKKNCFLPALQQRQRRQFPLHSFR